uniref:Kinesin-like protein n=1 Tax=Cannabis sativa TaxID=3483 RepID=A0A803NUW2_CANSA
MMVGTPSTPLSKIQRATISTPGGPRVREEKILVTVRIRPLSRREQALYDLIAWECVDDHSIVFNSPNHDRAVNSYTFDKVFGPSSATRKVYEEGAKDVALSALTGMNATIFAYGQTSSGKTYTMRGITENAKGTIVVKLVEEVVKDGQHLRHLINICEAQRQVGETALNDKSSRSHQIIRLTIESSLRETSGCVKSFIASLNLVDLAGSERASQTNADGTRLKEGSHINRSLLTLTTVIRKLSGGKKSGHIPYRDSKLTRILQSSLGGNARTAIICTMSPALSHVEQTRNTLSFATSAKEVTNNAQINMVVLGQEVGQAFAEGSGQTGSRVTKSRAFFIFMLKMKKEMEELKRERDLVQSQLESERKAHKVPKGMNQRGPSEVAGVFLFMVMIVQPPLQKLGQEMLFVGRQWLGNQLPPQIHLCLSMKSEKSSSDSSSSEEANRALEVLHKEVASHRLGNQETAENIAKLLSEIQNMQVPNSISEEIMEGDQANLIEEISRFKSQGSTIESLERKLENVQKTIDQLVTSFTTHEETSECKTPSKKKKILPFNLSNSANMQSIIRPPCSPLSSSCQVREHDRENKAPENYDSVRSGNLSCKVTPLKNDESGNFLSSKDGTPVTRKSNSVNVKKMQKMFKNAAEENIRSIRSYVTELKERVAKLQYQKQLLVCQVLQLEEANDSGAEASEYSDPSPEPWHLMFEEQRKEIIMLWHLCHVSLIHRTQFYMLFKGDPNDKIYMEVELRRLTWLERHLSDLGNASPALLGDEPAGSVSASIRALKQEREYLAKRVSSKLTIEEREMLYSKWEIPPGGKQRRLQLVNKLWTDPYNMQHIKESAEIVAKLVGFCESGEHASKEMFELTFVCPSDKKTWMGWNLISNLLNL